VNQVARAEKELHQFMREEKSEVRNALVEKKELTPEIEEGLKAALAEFRDRFKPEGGSPVAASKPAAEVATA
jgi:F-type H+-transporting ATPase subunit alpha